MPHTPLTVFLVDDETLIRSGMKKLLPWEALGFSIVGEAENGRQALPLIEKLTPDLVITDLKMPLCDGITLTGEIKKLLPRTEVIILTGYDEFDYARQAIRMGVFDFLLKPISPDELQATLLRLQQKRSVCETPYPFEEESALLAAFEDADTDAAIMALHAFFARLHAVRPDGDTLANIVGKLSYELIRTARQKLAVLTVPSPTPAPSADEETCEAALETYIRQCLQEQESRSSSELVQRIMQYLEQNYAQNITLSSLEEAFFFNASYISRVFKQKTGKNYSDYLLGIRLEHAKELLRDSHHSIAYISDVTGFGNSKYFSKIFKEKVGMQPVQYRRASAR